MKVIKTVSWEESGKYPDAWEDIDAGDKNAAFTQFEECVKAYCRDNYIRLSGTQYQMCNSNVPIIEHEGKEYAFQVSLRHWGGLMYDIWGDGSDVPFAENDRAWGYCNWAWSNPDEYLHDKCRRCLHNYERNRDTSKDFKHWDHCCPV
jgi:hypothetical protein